jgi:hypothetical protein
MARILRLSVWALVVVSITSLAVAALFRQGTALSGAAREDLRVEPLIRVLGELPPATSVLLTFKAINGSSRPIRVVGVKEICMPWGCVRAENLPCVIPPNASSDIRLSLVTTYRSPVSDLVFDGEILLFSDCPRKNIVPLHVGGRVVCGDVENN